MRPWLVAMLLACAPGCRQVLGLDEPALRDASGPDAAPDAPPRCYGAGIVRVCPTAPPPTPIELPPSIDTDSSSDCVAYTTPSGTDACVVFARSIQVPGRTRAIGGRPLVLVADDVIDVASTGVIDVASHVGGDAAAAADTGTCNAPTVAGYVTNTGGGGGGGSFGGKGGIGTNGTSGGVGGVSGAVIPGPIASLRGGCPGGAGAAVGGGAGGHGGGAVYLIAGSGITVDGMIDASGAGGSGATGAQNGGGGGGGAGGMIGLDAPMIQIGNSAAVFANGGGGGEGADSSSGDDGVSGADPQLPATPAAGGAGVSIGGNGGSGSAGNGRVGGNASTANGSESGGGGGGGGAGVIRAFGTGSFGAQVSPTPT